MKKSTLHLPASFSTLTEHEMGHTYGGSAIGDAWNIITGTITGLASAAVDAAGSVMRGEMCPLDALCKSVVYLAGNIVASIIWAIA